MKNNRYLAVINCIPKHLWIISFFSAFTLAFYIPSAMFLGNLDEFKADYINAVGIILAVSCVMYLAIILIGYLFRNNKTISILYMAFVFGLTFAMYVQGNFLNRSLPQLDGREVSWDRSNGRLLIDTVIWIACILVPIILAIIKKDKGTKILMYAGALLSAMQIVSLVVLLVTTKRTVANDYVLTRDNEFLLSSEKNVVVFVVDTLDAQWAEEYVVNNEAYRDMLSDFTYFDNVCGGGAPTILGIPALLTGEIYDTKQTMDEYYREAYNRSSLFYDLYINGYNINLFTDTGYLNEADVSHISNVAAEKSSVVSPCNFAYYMYELVAYYVAPYKMKPLFMFYSGNLYDTIAPDASGIDAYNCHDDDRLFSDFEEQGISVSSCSDMLILYHLFGAHGPYDDVSLEQKIYNSFDFIERYIGQMKDKDIYDDSTIIITADHGGLDIYQNPAVFCKKPGENSGFRTESRPLTFRNVRATMVSCVIDEYEESYGYDVFEAPDMINEPRMMTADSILRLNIYPETDQGDLPYIMYTIGNPARDTSQISEVTD